MKHTQLKQLILSALLGLSSLSQANTGIAETPKNSIKCFAEISLPAHFIALDTKFDSKLADWYRQVFHLKTVKSFTFPDGNTKGVLMKRGDFVVEIFNKKALNVPQHKPREQPGVMKFGFYAQAELTWLQTCLKQHGITAPRIFQDENLAAGLLLVADPEGNMFEVISPTDKQQSPVGRQ